jgi:hypothetical protein
MAVPNSQLFQHAKCPQCGASLPIVESDSIICQYCGSHLMRSPQPGSTTNAANNAPLIKGMRYTPQSIMDTEGTGMEACRLLIPSGWQLRGGVLWLPDTPGMPATLNFEVFNPSGLEAFSGLPALPFYWTNNPLTLMTMPPGTRYYGHEVRQPVEVLQALQQYTLPRFRNVPGLQVVHQELMPDLPQLMLSLTPPTAQSASPQPNLQGGRIRVTYPLNGQPVEEDIYAVLMVISVNMPGSIFSPNQMIFWYLNFHFAYRAPLGKLDALADLFKATLTSVRINPAWMATVNQISQYMMQNQIQQIHNIGQMSRQFSQNANQISDMNMQSWYNQQASQDRISENFSQNMRGVDAYYDPNRGGNVELPSGYTNAWANPLGEYIVSDDPNFNPNQETNQNWTEINRQE